VAAIVSTTVGLGGSSFRKLLTRFFSGLVMFVSLFVCSFVPSWLVGYIEC
jgi:hypothetical protein